MKVSLLFRVTGIAVFLQLALGGLLTFGFIDPLVHIVMGAIVFVLVIVTLAIVFGLRPRPRQLFGLSGGMLILMVLQAVLGFSTLGSGNQIVAWVHLVIAMAIYGMAISGTFMAVRVEGMAGLPPSVAVG